MTTAVQEKPRFPVELREAIEEGLRDIEEGRVYSTEEVFDEIAGYAQECIEAGLQDIKEGRIITDEEMRKSLAKWL